MPTRHHHTLETPGQPPATLLLMPAWTDAGYLGVKVASVFPGNAAIGLESVSSTYVLMDRGTGRVLALMDGGELTSRRTAAASALAASMLARPDSRRMLLVGTGRMARHLARAHCALLPSIEHIAVWGRHADRTERLAANLRAEGFDAERVERLEEAAPQADLISAATLANDPLIHGRWVRPGTHVDLVGGFTPAMREADDELMRVSEVFVDTLDGATREAGDIVDPLASGILRREQLFDLFALCRHEHPGRQSAGAITVFKSVGAALEDLAAAIVVYEALTNPSVTETA